MKEATELPANLGPQAQCSACARVFQTTDDFDHHQAESYRGTGRGTIRCNDPRKMNMILTNKGYWTRRKT